MAPFIAALLALIAQAPKVTLTYFQEHFIVRDGVYNESAPLRLTPSAPKLSTVFRKNATFAVWDERGLTIRVGSKVKSTKLAAVSTSPKVFSRDEIVETVRLIKQGKRIREAAALSGAVRIGNRAYFLCRWDGKDGKPWAEALVQVDLSAKFPEPKLAGRARVLSTAGKPIDDQLFILDGTIAYVACAKARWGIEQVNPRNNRFTLVEMGDRLLTFQWSTGPTSPRSTGPASKGRVGLFLERTAYGTTVAGRFDLQTRSRKTLAEGRMKMRFLDSSEPPCLVLSMAHTAVILNTDTGSEFDLPIPCSMRRTSRGIVVWTPVDSPERAWLYAPGRWEGLAWWNALRSKEPLRG